MATFIVPKHIELMFESYHAAEIECAARGATYVDEPVVVDGNLITARRPPDLPAYGAALVQALAEEPG